MRTVVLYLLILSVGLVGCKKDNGSKLPVIKGIYKKDINAQPIGMEGAPNVKTSTDESASGISDIDVYPNPASAALNLFIKSSPGLGQARIWMVRGRYKGGKFGPDDILGIGLYIPIDMTVDLSGGGNNVSLDLKDVRNGYYRLYVEYNSVKLWDNIKVDKP